MPTLLHHTDHAGSEPAVVLIHGMACDGSDWDAQVAHFQSKGQRVVTVDLRGHGQSMQFDSDFNMPSMGADVAALLQHLGITSAIVAGHSMGCRVSTEAALAAPDIIKGVALIDGSRFATANPAEAASRMRANIDKV